MKRDMKLILLLLIWAEEHCDGRTVVSNGVKISGYTHDEIKYHLELLQNAGYLTQDTRNIVGRKRFVHFKGLSYKGHDLLDSLKSDTRWNQLKSSSGEICLSVLESLSTTLATRILEL